MATRDLTNEFLELRATVIRKRKQKLSNSSSTNGGGIHGTGNVSGIGSRLSNDGHGGTPTNGYRKLAAGGATHDLMLSVNDDIGDGYSDIEMNTLGRDSSVKKPDWVADVEIVEKCISDITQQMKELQSRHAQRIGSVFGRDLQNMESVIEQQTSIITEQFRVAERLLQKVGYATKRSGGQEATVGANVQRRYDGSYRVPSIPLSDSYSLTCSHSSYLLFIYVLYISVSRSDYKNYRCHSANPSVDIWPKFKHKKAVVHHRPHRNSV